MGPDGRIGPDPDLARPVFELRGVLEVHSIEEGTRVERERALAVAGAPLSELPFPEGAAAALIIRGNEMVPPKGSTVLTPGDYIYVFARPEDRHFMQLMFGRPEE